MAVSSALTWAVGKDGQRADSLAAGKGDSSVVVRAVRSAETWVVGKGE